MDTVGDGARRGGQGSRDRDAAANVSASAMRCVICRAAVSASSERFSVLSYVQFACGGGGEEKGRYGGARVWLAGVRWLAYAAARRDVRSGRFENREAADGALAHCGEVRFGEPFARPPCVFVALNALNVERGPGAMGCPVRVKVNKSDVTEEGMKWRIESWADTAFRQAGVSWIAFEPR